MTTTSQTSAKLHNPTSNQQLIAQTINWLFAHNYPALPVAPHQDPHKYHKIDKASPERNTGERCPLTDTLAPIPLYTGKNPSYLDQNGKPHLVNHKQYQNRLPSEQELTKWFTNPSNGIGTLGGWNNTIWLDFDLKQFASSFECEDAVISVVEKVFSQTGEQPFLEKSHSGGWRVGVKVQEKPTFTNFRLTPGGTHVGEALGEGRFTVLAPTIGPSGNPYESIHQASPPLVTSLESLGIYSTKTQTLPTNQNPSILSTIHSETRGHGEGETQGHGEGETRGHGEGETRGNQYSGELRPLGAELPDAPIGTHYAPRQSVPASERHLVEVVPSTTPPTQLHPSPEQNTEVVPGTTPPSQHHPSPTLVTELIPNTIPLEQLGNKTSQEILAGTDTKGDRSHSLTIALREWYGWQNWCHINNDVKFTGTPEELAHKAGEKLGIDSARIDRIVKSVGDPSCCSPAALIRGGEEACWKKIYRLDKATFLDRCPAHLRDTIIENWRKRKANGSKNENGSVNGSDSEKDTSTTSSSPSVTMSFETRREEDKQRRSSEWNVSVSDQIPDSFSPEVEFTQRVLKKLYGDSYNPWICIDNRLYFWTGKYYKHSKDVVELRRLHKFCNTYRVFDKYGQVSYPFAKPAKVKEALEWVKIGLGQDPSLVNPPGLNCTNGVLQITWSGTTPTWSLLPHDSDLFYIYEPQVTYNPNANPDACNRLLACLEPPEQDIFLKTIAASLDLPTVRQNKSREVRALLLKGDGANGKDSLREVVRLMYSKVGLTGCTISDFATYDEGRKFPLSRLVSSRINWASENTNTTRLDRIQSLKAFITGESLSAEGKGRDEDEFEPEGIALFNVNDTPNLTGALEAISSRYAVLTFSKTFKINANPKKGELEADPRFRYDPSFIKNEVLPAFLNRVLESLVLLMEEGINYECTQKTLKDIQANNSHLFQFCQDTGLGYDPDGVLTAGEIWDVLSQWYEDNGTLTYEELGNGKLKGIWQDQPRRGDRNVKAPNQVIARFQALFPKAKRVTRRGENKAQLIALSGISFGGDANLPPDITPSDSSKNVKYSLPDKDVMAVMPIFDCNLGNSSREPGAGSREPGAGNQERENREPGAGSWERRRENYYQFQRIDEKLLPSPLFPLHSPISPLPSPFSLLPSPLFFLSSTYGS